MATPVLAVWIAHLLMVVFRFTSLVSRLLRLSVFRWNGLSDIFRLDSLIWDVSFGVVRSHLKLSTRTRMCRGILANRCWWNLTNLFKAKWLGLEANTYA